LRFLVGILFLALILGGCSSTIGNKSDPAKARFEVGRTSKRQVAETLGLPAAVDHSEDGLQEVWAYQKSPSLKSVNFVAPGGIANPSVFYDVKLFFKDRKLAKDATVIYVFDSRGILLGTQQP
jgi:outer membrane protein assembly factor BamE (lipoprotein component of BamABCDE complex)